MRTKDFRRAQARLKDLRRRKLYRNHAINGRYELSDKEDQSLSLCAVHNKANPNFKLVEWTAQRETVHPDKLTNDLGHWQEFPKNQYQGRYGWNLKSTKHKKLRKAFKAKIKEEVEDATCIK